MRLQRMSKRIDQLINKLDWLVHRFEKSRGNKTSFYTKQLKKENELKRKRKFKHNK